MDFLKKHYEKVVLSLVLAGLAGVAVFLPLRASEIKEEIEASQPVPPPRKLAPLDLTTNSQVLERLGQSPNYRFDGDHNLFNPQEWKQKPDGTMFRVPASAESGADAVQVLKIEPLYLIIEYLGPAESSSGGPKLYQFAVTQQAAKQVSRRRRHVQTLSVGYDNGIFLFKQELGPAASPNQVILVLNESHQRVALSQAKPEFRRISDYMADLKYLPDDQIFRGRRKGDILPFGGDQYNIVAITENVVVLSAQSTSKRTQIKWQAAGK